MRGSLTVTHESSWRSQLSAAWAVPWMIRSRSVRTMRLSNLRFVNRCPAQMLIQTVPTGFSGAAARWAGDPSNAESDGGAGALSDALRHFQRGVSADRADLSRLPD